MLALLAVCIAISSAVGVFNMIMVMLLAFFVTALACHGEMARDRPSTKHLTEFYLWMSVGGAVGGIFTGLLAPVIFSWGIVEFPLALVVAGLLRPRMRDVGWTEQMIGNMNNPQDTARHHHAKGGKKVAKQVSAEAASLTTLLDFALPLGVALLFALLLWVVFKPRVENFNEAMFYAMVVPAICAACFFSRPLRFGIALGALLLLPSLYSSYAEGDRVAFTTRSYFGLLRVRRANEAFGNLVVPYTNLMHGTTNHGMALGVVEEKDKKYDLSRVATTYYHRQGPVGIGMERFNWFPYPNYWEVDYLFNFKSDIRGHLSLMLAGAPDMVNILPTRQLVSMWSEPPYCTIGLGTGTMSTYARPLQTMHFYEIDEQIKRLSLPPDGGEPFFGYLRAARNRGANIEILMGDARLRMAMPWVPSGYENSEAKDVPFDKRGGPENFYHLMVVDAFSSDAIPRHLITKEAMEMYFRHLIQGKWGPWINVSIYKEPETSKEWEVDEPGHKVDPKFYYEEEKNSEGKVIKKRPWYPGGVLCVHTSNRHLRLVPVVADTSAKCEWDDFYAPLNADGTRPKGNSQLVAIRGHDSAPGGRDGLKFKSEIGHFTSEWVMVARDRKDLMHLKAPEKYREWLAQARREFPGKFGEEDYWQFQEPRGAFVWTDDHTNLMAVIRWPWDKH
jgi:hypothetical protein